MQNWRCMQHIFGLGTVEECWSWVPRGLQATAFRRRELLDSLWCLTKTKQCGVTFSTEEKEADADVERKQLMNPSWTCYCPLDSPTSVETILQSDNSDPASILPSLSEGDISLQRIPSLEPPQRLEIARTQDLSADISNSKLGFYVFLCVNKWILDDRVEEIKVGSSKEELAAINDANFCLLLNRAYYKQRGIWGTYFSLWKLHYLKFIEVKSISCLTIFQEINL